MMGGVAPTSPIFLHPGFFHSTRVLAAVLDGTFDLQTVVRDPWNVMIIHADGVVSGEVHIRFDGTNATLPSSLTASTAVPGIVSDVSHLDPIVLVHEHPVRTPVMIALEGAPAYLMISAGLAETSQLHEWGVPVTRVPGG